MRKGREIHFAYIYIVYAMKGNELSEGKYNLWNCKSNKDNYIITIGEKRLHAKWINFHILIHISQFALKWQACDSVVNWEHPSI